VDVETACAMSEELTSRPPEESDLLAVCKSLNAHQARYLVIGGFAMIHAGFPRTTIDIDLLIDAEPANEASVLKALEILPDQAVKELRPGEVATYTVVRVADEIVVDLMKSACGIEYPEAIREAVFHEAHGVRIPFASPTLLWRMKAATHREKDRPDLMFLRTYFEERGESPPA